MIHFVKFDEKHAALIACLLNEEHAGSDEFIPFDIERVLSEIARHAHHLTVSLVEEDGKTVGVVATHPEGDTETSIHWLAAQGRSDRVRIEDAIVSSIERTACGVSVSTMIDAGSSRIGEWVARGYVLEPGFQRMYRKLDDLISVPSVSDGVKLRGLRVGEEEKLVALVNAGFEWERLEAGDLEAWKVQDKPFDESWIEVAESDGRLVSVVVARPDTEPNRYFHLKRGYLGPAATLPEFRNKHLASALTAKCMNLLYEKGMDSVRLGTSELNVASISLLKSLGFQVENVRKILRKRLESA